MNPGRLAKIVPIPAAVVGAVIVLVVHRVDDGVWPWVDFLDDLIRNVLIGGVLSVAVLWLEELQREREKRAAAAAAAARQRRQVIRVKEVAQRAATGWSPLGGSSPPATTEETETEASATEVATEIREKVVPQLRKDADTLEGIYEQVRDPIDTDDAMTALWLALLELPGIISRHLSEGSRARRFTYFEFVGSELASLEAEAPLGPDISAFRASLPGALAWRIHTDTTIVERLLIEKVVGDPGAGTIDPAGADDRELRDLVRLDPAAVAFEPLYLLQAYVGVQLSGVGVDLHEAIRRISPANRCFGALRNEMRAIAEVLEQLGSLIEAAQRNA